MITLLILFTWSMGAVNADPSALPKAPIVYQVNSFYSERYDFDFENEKLSTVLEFIKKKGFEWAVFQLPTDVPVTLKGNLNLPEAAAQISKQTGYGFLMENGHAGFERDSPSVKYYDIAGPFILGFDKHKNTDKVEIRIDYNNEDVAWCSDQVFTSMMLGDGNSSQPLQGEIIPNPSRWVSSEPVKYREGMTIKGKIKGSVLTKRYVIYGIQADSFCEFDNLTLRVQKEDVPGKMPRAYKSPYDFGRIRTYIQDEIAGDWMCIHIKFRDIADKLTTDEQLFMKNTLARYTQTDEDTISPADKKKYNALYEKIPFLLPRWLSPIDESEKKYYEAGDAFNRLVYTNDFMLELCDEAIERWSFPSLSTDIYFDSVQEGKPVFPLKMELLKYEVAEYEFSIPITK
ncbi:MAG: hypothetical protein JXB48_23440 [Candidatus Latescibacteria bacterium]|nr:hypothetical protein [Candidatus Latescibacterota bacterium]